jgi:hypothetical protein
MELRFKISIPKVYCMGANEEGATSSIIQVEALPFPDDKTI